MESFYFSHFALSHDLWYAHHSPEGGRAGRAEAAERRAHHVHPRAGELRRRRRGRGRGRGGRHPRGRRRRPRGRGRRPHLADGASDPPVDAAGGPSPSSRGATRRVRGRRRRGHVGHVVGGHGPHGGGGVHPRVAAVHLLQRLDHVGDGGEVGGGAGVLLARLGRQLAVAGLDVLLLHGFRTKRLWKNKRKLLTEMIRSAQK